MKVTERLTTSPPKSSIVMEAIKLKDNEISLVLNKKLEVYVQQRDDNTICLYADGLKSMMNIIPQGSNSIRIEFK